MKKRLLLAFMAACAVVSSFADNFNTKTGSYVTTGNNICTNGTFAGGDFTGWTPVSATAGTACSALFTYNAETQAINSTSALYSEGMYYKFSASPSTPYVVSFKIRQQTGTWPFSTNIRYTEETADDGTVTNTYGCHGSAGAGKNFISLFGNNGGVNSGTDFIQTGYAIQLTADWQTVNFATAADGTSRDWYLYICNMATDIEIKDIQIYAAVEVADVRKAVEPLAYANAVLNAYDWADSDELEGLKENIEVVGEITSSESATDMRDALEGLQDALEDFLNTHLDNYIATCATGTRWADVNTRGYQIKGIGDWVAFYPSDGERKETNRLMHCNNQSDEQWRKDNAYWVSIPDFGYGSALGDQGLYMTKELNAGSYVFAIKGLSTTHYGSNTPYAGAGGYERNEGFSAGQMTISIENEAGEKIAKSTIDILPSVWDEWAQAVVTANIPNDGKYTFVVEFTQPTDNSYYGTNRAFGGSYYLSDPQIYCKLEGYNANERTYIANVRAQIAAGRENYDKAIAYQSDDKYLWGKAELKEVAEAKLPILLEYEKLTDEDIIDSYDEDTYEAGPTKEKAQLEHEVYVNLAQGLIAANRKFLAVNDTLTSLGTAIENAQKTLTARVYDSATGKAAFQAVITSAETLYAQLKTDDYSEANAAAITAKIKELTEATETFKATVPASSSTILADIDFSNLATANDDGTYSIAGKVNSMILPNYNTDEDEASSSAPSNYYQGFWKDGFRIHVDTLRVGNGEATVTIPAAQQVSGTNILKITFDYYFARLTQTSGSPGGTYSGFYLYDTDGDKIAQLYYSPYWQVAPADENNTFDLDLSSTYLPSVGGSSAQNDAIAAASNVTHFEIILDYGRKSMYCTTTTSKGVSQTTKEQSFSGASMANFAVASDHTNAARRCWFDNLKIEQITAGPTDEFVDGIENVQTEEAAPVKKVKKVFQNGRIVIDGKYGINGMLIIK